MTMEDQLDRLSNSPDLVWGAESIGAVLGLSKRKTFHFLTTGQIRGARKIGYRWVASRRELLRQFVTAIEDREAAA